MSSRKPKIQEKSSVHFISAPAVIEASSYSSGVTAMVPPGSILAYITPLSGSMPSPVSPPPMSEDEKWRLCFEALPEQKTEIL